MRDLAVAAGAARAGDLLGRRCFAHRTNASRAARRRRSHRRAATSSARCSRSSANSCSYCCGHRRRRRPALDEPPARGAHAGELVRRGDEPGERLRERLGVVGRHRHARAGPLDDALDLGAAVDAREQRAARGQDRVRLRRARSSGRARASAARRGCRRRRAPRAAGRWGCKSTNRTFGSPRGRDLEARARRAPAVDHEHDLGSCASSVAAASMSSSDCDIPMLPAYITTVLPSSPSSRR